MAQGINTLMTYSIVIPGEAEAPPYIYNFLSLIHEQVKSNGIVEYSREFRKLRDEWLTQYKNELVFHENDLYLELKFESEEYASLFLLRFS